jgi:hypothetical protein
VREVLRCATWLNGDWVCFQMVDNEVSVAVTVMHPQDAPWEWVMHDVSKIGFADDGELDFDDDDR